MADAWPLAGSGQIELIPAIGEETTLQLVQQALMTGGCDFVLMHPEFLRNSNLLGKLHSMGIRVCAFGPSQGPMKELIDSSGVDAWLEGPPLNPQQLERIVQNMQMEKSMQRVQGMGAPQGVMPPSHQSPLRSYDNPISAGGAALHAQPSMMSQVSGGYGQVVPTNPYGLPVPSSPAPAPVSSEAEMMAQLMQEINRLKNELN